MLERLAKGSSGGLKDGQPQAWTPWVQVDPNPKRMPSERIIADPGASHVQQIAPQECRSPCLNIEPKLLCQILSIGSLTVDRLTDLIRSIGGKDKLMTSFVKIAEVQLAAGAPWVAGAAWSLAFATMTLDMITPKLLHPMMEQLSSTGGKAIEAFADDKVSIAKFFAGQSN